MKKYAVTIPYAVYVRVVVEAEDEDSAIDLAYEDAGVTGYVGNGGSDKLVGVYGHNVSIEPGESSIEGGEFEITVEEI